MVSVIIPTYNRFDLLLKSIDSIINQTYKNFEIIIVDDCSDDKRYETLLDNKNVRYFRLKERSGLPAVTRNFGIKQSVGDWIAFLDDDDIWLPDKLKLQVNHTDSYKFLCTESYYEGQLYAKGKYIDVWNMNNPENKNVFDFNLLTKHNLIINSSVLVEKKILEEIGLISEEKHLRGIEDYDTWLKITKKGYNCYFIEQPLLDYGINTYKHYKDNFFN